MRLMETITYKINMILRKFKKWNWTLLCVILLISCAGAASNKNIHTLLDGIIITFGFGIPIGLFMAWLTKDQN